MKTSKKNIIKFNKGKALQVEDSFATEEPLQIILSIPLAVPPVVKRNISVTMRTPGDDKDLAVGFLYTEGIITPDTIIRKIEEKENKIHVILDNDDDIDLDKLERHFYTSSSCGVCGKASIESVFITCKLDSDKPQWTVSAEILQSLPDVLKKEQEVFQSTGAIHAAALFTTSGKLRLLKEDVGRHNALDKLVGQAFMNNDLPLDRDILLLSGRGSFELLQKAAMAGIQFVACVGAPSSLAVETAHEFDITLVGFLQSDRFNIYNAEKRIDL